MTRRLALCALLLVLVACRQDISSYPPYSAYVGKDLALQRSCGLWYNADAPFISAYSLYEYARYGDGQRIADLPKGTRIHIDTVYYYDGIDAQYIFAVGTLRNPVDGRRIRFEYSWNYYGFMVNAPEQSESISRAPWETAAVPLARHVGSGGRHYSGSTP